MCCLPRQSAPWFQSNPPRGLRLIEPQVAFHCRGRVLSGRKKGGDGKPRTEAATGVKTNVNSLRVAVIPRARGILTSETEWFNTAGPGACLSWMSLHDLAEPSVRAGSATDRAVA